MLDAAQTWHTSAQGRPDQLKRARRPVGQIMRGLAVTSSPRQDADGPEPAEEAFHLVLELCLADGDPASGTVSVLDGRPAMPFHGWIDLMSAINALRADAGRTP
jgi:hypothetical protein